MVWMVPLTPGMLVIAFMAIVFLIAVIAVYWPIVLGLVLVITIVKWLRRSARRERYDAARRLAEGPSQ